jgi:hypothetical protein
MIYGGTIDAYREAPLLDERPYHPQNQLGGIYAQH